MISFLIFGATTVVVFFVAHCVYSLYFHPLSRYPGPKSAAISNWWYVRHWVSGRWPHDIDQLHKAYGDVVRVAPNELSFASVQSFYDIYGHAKGSHKPFLKSEFYDRKDSEVSLVIARDPAQHREIRKKFAHAFSSKALRDQTDVVLHYADLLVQQIGRLGTTGEGIDVTEWYNWITFDIIGDLAFGESFGALEETQTHEWVSIIVNSAFFGTIPHILRRAPYLKILAPFVIPRELAAQRKRHWKLSHEKLLSRLKQENSRDDFFSHILSQRDENVSEEFLLAQAYALIVGGSETTSTFLAGVTYQLVKNSDRLAKLADEVRAFFPDPSLINGDSTARLSYLNGVIEEGLRLFPPVSFGPPRTSPGAVVDGNYVPRGVTVSTANWTTTHNDAYFHDPKSFCPERWLPPDHPDYNSIFVNDQRDASKPFSLGPRACIGINLAYIEMRVILSKLAWHFDWKLTSNDVDWLRDTKLQFLWQKPKLHVQFLPRPERQKMVHK